MELFGGILRELPTSGHGSYEFRTGVSASRETLAGARMKSNFTQNSGFGERVQYRIELQNDMPLVPRIFKFDLWCYRAFAEERIRQKLQKLGHRVQTWEGTADCHQEATLWDDPRSPAGYRVDMKAEDPFWAGTVRVKRRMRARCVIFAQRYQPEVEIVETSKQVSRWLVIPSLFREYEVPQGSEWNWRRHWRMSAAC